MPRNGSGVYSLPSGLPTNGETSNATDDIRTPFGDLETDMNTARPIVAGGTGATSASAARTNLGLAIGSDVQAYDANVVRPEDYGAVADGVTDDTNAIQQACDALGTGGGVVVFSAGTYLVNASSPVATNEGDAVLLTASHGHIIWRGLGDATKIIPASNKVVVVSCDGNTSLTVEGIHFDNSANGVLQNQVKPTRSYASNQGIAGYGNAANTAIMQLDIADTTVRNCKFTEWQTAVFHRGDDDNQAVLDGVVTVEGCTFIDGCFGLLAQQPQYVRFEGNIDSGLVHSVNSDASTDPGHAIYVSNRAGAKPYSIVISGNNGYDCESTNWKVNKGNSVSITGNASHNSAGGIEARECLNLTISGNSIYLRDEATYANDEAVLISDCGTYSLTGNVIDRSLADAWGINIDANDDDEAYMNQAGIIADNVIIFDPSTAGAGTAPIIVNGQDDTVLQNNVTIIKDTTVATRPRYDIRDCDNLKIFRPIDFAPDGNTHDRLVTFDSNCTNCKIDWREDDVDFTVSGSTVSDSGTSTIQVLDGAIIGTFTPTFTFATAGDFSPTYNTQQGSYHVVGDWVEFAIRIGFDTNAYTTASGAGQIGGLPFSANSALAVWSVTIGDIRNVTFSTSELLYGQIAQGDDFCTVRSAASGGVGSALTTTAFPASTSGIVVGISGRYKRA